MCFIFTSVVPLGWDHSNFSGLKHTFKHTSQTETETEPPSRREERKKEKKKEAKKPRRERAGKKEEETT
jgi:hypothetical protein